ncbi:hypothetical protein [Streptomyces flavofungini]|uniref:Integral membrane protein n=1 Tax=Streptomyces flavofungini TaxID=68200 RepID=A0ABS0X423_9ACTN|nr:hypothetical protein [Streptomyces flavofungini]MBJ3807942.1 hypothetical protein [Streptomyces flavofungini]
MTAQADRRWAELARELEFTQLDELRRRAEGWRTGLTGLAALLAVLVVLKGRDDLNGLPDIYQQVASGLVAAAFLLLVAGSVLAVRAAHGRLGERTLLAGQALRRWTEDEVRRVVRSLRYASVCCVLGVACAAGAIAVAWVTTESPKDHLVRVSTTSGERCGEFLGSGRDGVALRTEDAGGGTEEGAEDGGGGAGATGGAKGGGAKEKRVTLPARTVISVTPVGSCDAAK